MKSKSSHKLGQFGLWRRTFYIDIGDFYEIYDAIIDEVAIFNVALSAAEIKMMMDKGLSALLLTPVEPEGKLSTTWASVKEQY